MVAQFLDSLRTPPRRCARLDVREVVVVQEQKSMAQRFGTKAMLIEQALRENAEGTWVLVSDLDIRFTGAQIAELVDASIARCEAREGAQCDAIFQREDDTSLHRNLGFMVLRVSRTLARVFAAVSNTSP